MTDQPIELDEHRGMAARKSTELSRCLEACGPRRQELIAEVLDHLARLSD